MTDWCAAEDRCRGYDRHNRVPAATSDTALCEACLRVGQRVTRVLVYDYVDLEQHIARPAGGGEHVSGTKEQPIPLALGIEALQREIWLLTTTWEQILRDLDSLADPPTRVRDGWAVQHALAIIHPRVPQLANVPATTVMPHGPDGEPAEQTGAEGILAMVSLHGRVRATLGLTRLVHELPGECWRCGLPALRRDDGEDEVYCADCYATWTGQEYAREVELALAWHKVTKR